MPDSGVLLTQALNVAALAAVILAAGAASLAVHAAWQRGRSPLRALGWTLLALLLLLPAGLGLCLLLGRAAAPSEGDERV
ncbi:MAG TPA: hypothetical protein PLJ35_02210 [Anaerolineae bacterium]|nr:hypothetical protein [Anaerolineae bacterium]HOQ97618.1 hypothetical protein [Anaerolineae bacterium]HPL26548.1 hypothetical protein [Anaerolineae bacterium]HPL26561.1 hypothetical protein [Anaerolineae bacterium]